MSFENPTINKEPKGWKERIRDDAKEKVIRKIKATEAFDESLKQKMVETAEEIFADSEYFKSFEQEWGRQLKNLKSDPEEIEKMLSDGLAGEVKRRVDETLNL